MIFVQCFEINQFFISLISSPFPESTKRLAPPPPSSKTPKPSTTLSHPPHNCCCVKSDVTTLITELRNPNDVLWTLMDRSYQAELHAIEIEKATTDNEHETRSGKINRDKTEHVEKATGDSEKLNCKNESSDRVNKTIDVHGYNEKENNEDIEELKGFNMEKIHEENNKVMKQPSSCEEEPRDQMDRNIEDEKSLSNSDVKHLTRLSGKNCKIVEKEDYESFKTLPSVVKMKEQSDQQIVNEEKTENTSVKIVSLTPKGERKTFAQKPEILFSMDDVVNKVNQNYKNNNYLKMNNYNLNPKQIDPLTRKSNLEPNALSFPAFDLTLVRSTDSKELNLEKYPAKEEYPSTRVILKEENAVLNTETENTNNTVMENSENSSVVETGNNELKITSNKQGVSLTDRLDTDIIDININNHQLESNKVNTPNQELALTETESSTILPPPNEFANVEEPWTPSNSIQSPQAQSTPKNILDDVENTMEILLDDFEAQAIDDLHANVRNTFTNPLAQATYYSHATEFNQYLTTMLSEDATEEPGQLGDFNGNRTYVDQPVRDQRTSKENVSMRGDAKAFDSRDAFTAFRKRDLRDFSSLSSEQDDFGSDNFITQDELDLLVTSEVSSVAEFSLNDIRLPSSPSQWKFVKPEHSDSIEVNLSESEHSGYDSSEESGDAESLGESGDAESPPLKAPVPNDEGSRGYEKNLTPSSSDDEASNFLFRLSSDLETFWNGDKRDGRPEENGKL